MHGHGQEMYHVGGCVIVACRESKEAKKGEQGLQCSGSMLLGDEKAKKKAGGQNETAKQGRANKATSE